MTYEQFKQNKELMDQYNLDPYFKTSIDKHLSGTDPVMIISHLCKIINDVPRNLELKKLRVRFYPADTDETFDGTVLEETKGSYLVVPDQNLMGTARWNKNYCDIIR